ncbi:hypothetical protein FQA39_LY17810 [Lamprigera yunnana]|nr:hypothetical protein FQA39_LY17810 [Lamprigera yunnana]
MPPKRKRNYQDSSTKGKKKQKHEEPLQKNWENGKNLNPESSNSFETTELKNVKLVNQVLTIFDKIDFSCSKNNAYGKTYNLKISNWNVDGLRAWLKKGALSFIDYEQPHIFCIQEIKCSESKIPKELKKLEGYNVYWHCSSKEGYAGVGLVSRDEPLSVQYGINSKEYDSEGRCITAEYEKFYVISVYVPNAGRNLVTLPKRLEWNKNFKNYVKNLNKKKPIIICGDMNVAHNAIDLANPKTNTKNAGFTKEERDDMTDFLANGFVDSFRMLYPNRSDAYTFWSYMRNARSKNIGWRLDYFIISEKLNENICDNIIRADIFGSDHCPITLFLNI